MQNTKKLMFVHIPRTGGLSTRHALKDKDFFFEQPQIKSYLGHTPLFILEKNVILEDFYKITIVRNPYTRAFSLYNSFLKQLKSNIPFPSLHQCEITFNEFLSYVRLHGSKQSPVIFNVAPNSIFDQSFYIFNSSGRNLIDKVYKFENLQELERDYNLTLPQLNASDKSVAEEFIEAYTHENINLVKFIYHRDFYLLNYSMDFMDSVK